MRTRFTPETGTERELGGFGGRRPESRKVSLVPRENTKRKEWECFLTRARRGFVSGIFSLTFSPVLVQLVTSCSPYRDIYPVKN